ncbi:CsbD family protein [Streptococcus catagoni]|uniref:CsbD family protein n=1 Tax=Streptococcus catagoni TaxID=2654874 RepID=UPI00140BF02D|nr:CsbD family protein [Streptococcus catagoni]
MSEEKFDAKKDQFSGNVKESLGHFTDDKELETEGKVQHGKGKVKEFLDDAKDTLEALSEKLKNKKKENSIDEGSKK